MKKRGLQGAGGNQETSIRGAVEGIKVTYERDVGGVLTVYSFNLQRYDQVTKQPIPPPIPIQMRGRSVGNEPAFDGSLDERDWVEISGVWREGQTLHPERVHIIPRNAFFSVHRTSDLMAQTKPPTTGFYRPPATGLRLPAARPYSAPPQRSGTRRFWTFILVLAIIGLLLWGPPHMWATFCTNVRQPFC